MNDEEQMKLAMDQVIAEEREIGRKNARVLNAIRRANGQQFYHELLEIIRESEGIVGIVEFVTEPEGIEQPEEGAAISNIWVNQTTNGGFAGDEYAGTVCVQLKEKKYLKFQYSM